MFTSNNARRSIRSQPPSVDFIENRLPAIHDAFQNDRVQYDPLADRFRPTQELEVASTSLRETERSIRHQLPARRLPPGVGAMRFWGSIFEESMKVHVGNNPVESKRLLKRPEYGIRSKRNWEDIYECLQSARAQFDGTKSRFWGRFKRGYRGVAEQSDAMHVARTALQFLPDHELASPVKAALEVIMETVQIASSTREKITTEVSSDKLEDTFSKMETFLTIFPGDDNITNASVSLLAAVLTATEKTIVYFISSTTNRALTSLRDGEDYQEELLASIEEVQTAMSKLFHEVQISDISGTREAMEQIFSGVSQVVLLEIANQGRIEVVMAKAQDIVEQGEEIMVRVKQSETRVVGQVRRSEETVLLAIADLSNQMKSLMDDGANSRAPYFPREAVDNFMQLKAQVDEIRETQQAIKEYLSQRPLMLMPAPARQQLPWHMVQVQQPQAYYPVNSVQPLVEMNASFTPDVRLQLPLSLDPSVHGTALMALFSDFLNLDIIDIAAVVEASHSIPLRYRSRAQQVVSSAQFRSWATAATSRELLVRGSPGADPTYARAAMSLVTASLVLGLRASKRIPGSPARFISLVFFCGLHIDSDDPFARGGSAIMRAFVAQLLHTTPELLNTMFWQRDVDFETLQKFPYDTRALCRLFGFLISRLPQEKTVVCVIDNIERYEADEFESDTRLVLDCLLSLARDQSMLPAVKILVTSPVGTISAHEAFDKDDGCEDSILCLEALVPMSDEFGMMGIEPDVGQHLA
ncbi:hypothetical protein QBC40DRAFT_105880 [Triangularia verruculosa]|uniref:Nephrocystin 3-like N-terminal domain-containing protein n=1 Tax=Triangularia verruculosa TaxID=2587418 RepID=A0AAN6XBE4_9PEZI|nr:hypothetical protein QBC40DRAFT_105880 [Triangularia verruculosa]